MNLEDTPILHDLDFVNEILEENKYFELHAEEWGIIERSKRKTSLSFAFGKNDIFSLIFRLEDLEH